MKLKLTQKVHGYWFIKFMVTWLILTISFTLSMVVTNHNLTSWGIAFMIMLGFSHKDFDSRFAKWYINWGMKDKIEFD